MLVPIPQDAQEWATQPDTELQNLFETNSRGSEVVISVDYFLSKTH